MEGANFSTRRDPPKAENNAVKRLNALGYQVTAFHRATERELPAYELTRSPSAPK